jgi:hypothetical protein
MDPSEEPNTVSKSRDDITLSIAPATGPRGAAFSHKRSILSRLTLFRAKIGGMEDNSGKVVWFFAGAALGATIALLYAPQSGSDTRRILRKKTRQGREFVADTGKEWVDKGRELYEKGLRVADEAADMIERGRRIVEG